jgi:hypothetical protein
MEVVMNNIKVSNLEVLIRSELPSKGYILDVLEKNNVTTSDIRGSYNISYFAGFKRIFIRVTGRGYISLYSLPCGKLSVNQLKSPTISYLSNNIRSRTNE